MLDFASCYKKFLSHVDSTGVFILVFTFLCKKSTPKPPSAGSAKRINRHERPDPGPGHVLVRSFGMEHIHDLSILVNEEFRGEEMVL